MFSQLVFFCFFSIFIAKGERTGIIPDSIRVSKACRAVAECTQRLDMGKECSVLPVLKNSIFTLVTAEPFTLIKLRTGVWSYNDNAYLTLIIKHDTRLVVIDFPDSANSNIPDGSGTRLTDAVEQVLDGTVPKRVDMIYSHAHYDHIGAGTRFFKYIRNTYPKAGIRIFGTQETKDLIKRSESKRAVIPNRIIGRGGRILTLHAGLVLKMDVVGGHTGEDLRILIPRYRKQQGVVMYVDVVFPGWTPPFNLALSEDVGRYIEAQEDILRLDFDVLVPGHIALGTKKDVRLNLMYTRDLVEAAKAAVASVTEQDLIDGGLLRIGDPNAPEYRNIWFGFIGVQRKIEFDRCYRIMVEKWGCKLSGIDFTGRGHCLTAINYVLFGL